MLDEKKEYQLYLTQGYGGLLRRDNLKNDLAGIRRAFFVLARGFIALCDREGVCDLNSKHTLCREFLLCWLMGKYDASVYAPKAILSELEKAAKAALSRHLVDEKIKVKSASGCDEKAVSEYINNKVGLWDNSLFFSLQKNSANEVYFKAIIADAIHKGNLTDKVLVVKNGGQNFGVEGKDPSSENLKTLLYIVSEILENLPLGQKTAVVTKAQLSNLVNKPSCRKKKRDSAFASLEGFVGSRHFAYKGEPIVIETSLAGGIIKLSVNQKWISDYGVHLADANVVVERGYTAFCDRDLAPNYSDDEL